MGEMDGLEKELSGALRSVAPPADFAARTARKAGETKIVPAGIRPGVWAALAAAACLLIGVIAGQGLRDRQSSGVRPTQDAVAVAPARSYRTGPAFVAEGGDIAPYMGRTSVRVVWNLSQNAPELIVEAFPWED